MKYFGRLAGKTNAASTLTATAPAGAQTPYAPQLSGTKFRAFGESDTAFSYNRPLTALQENIECITELLDAPALAESRIVAAVATGQAFGSTALKGVAANSTMLNLAVGTPVSWVYVGLHQGTVGKFIRAYAMASNQLVGALAQRLLDSYEVAKPTQAMQQHVAMPINVHENYSDTQGIWNDPSYTVGAELEYSPHALALTAPLTRPIATDMVPYDGGAMTCDVFAWNADGCSVDYPGGWQALYVRPGCYVEISGTDGALNDGFFRVAHVQPGAYAQSVAVLTRGGLYKVTLDNAEAFSAGMLVSWESRPVTNGGASSQHATNYAYVAHVMGSTLYLARVTGEEDLAVAGYDFGRKLDAAGTYYGSPTSIGSLGQLDQEDMNNWGITAGSEPDATRIHVASAGSYDGAYSWVVSALPPSYPVVFDTTVVAKGQAIPYTPIGFLLNPILEFAEGTLLGGDYILQHKTLTTVREKLASAGSSAHRSIIADAGDVLSYDAFEAGLVRSFAQYVKTGDEDYIIRSDGGDYASQLAGPFTGSAQLLGDNLWRVEFDTTMVTFEASCAANLPPIVAGSLVPFMRPPVNGQQHMMSARLVAVSGNHATFCDAESTAWVGDEWCEYGFAGPLGAGAGSMLGDGVVHTVLVVTTAPYIRDAVGNAFVPAMGLNAAYNNHHAAARAARGGGKGNRILLAAGKPVVLVAPNDYGSGEALTVSALDNTDRAILHMKTRTGTPAHATIGLKDQSIAFADTYATTPIPFASATAPALDGQYTVPTVLDALNQNAGVQNVVRATVSDMLVDGCATTSTGGIGVSMAAGHAIIDGKYTVIDAATITLACDVDPLVTTYGVLVLHNGSLVQGSYLGTLTGDTNYVPLARYVTQAGALVGSLVDLRRVFATSAGTADILVGGIGANFAKLSEAVDFINSVAVTGDDLSVSFRSWRIMVRGSVASSTSSRETSTIKFAAGNVVIEGLHGSSNTTPIVEWDGNIALFDLAGCQNITFRNLTLSYVGTGDGTDATVSRMAFADSGDPVTGDGAKNILFDRVNIISNNTSKLHMFFRNTMPSTAMGNIWIRDCVWEGATECCLQISNCVNLNINSGTVLSMSPSLVPTGGLGGIVLYEVLNSSIDCHVKNANNVGVSLEVCVALHVTVHVTGTVLSGTATTVCGILLGAFTVTCWIRDCYVRNDGDGAATATGIQVNSTLRNTLVGNDCSNLHGASRLGIVLDAGTNYCIVDQNQTHNQGLSIAGSSHSIGGLNRDDA